MIGVYDILKKFKIFHLKFLFIVAHIDKNVQGLSLENDISFDKNMKVNIDDIRNILSEIQDINLNLSAYDMSLQQK